jgi:adenosylmethionine-8-amino-7-oxononanoate aminotransferase
MTNDRSYDQLIAADRDLLWHPYAPAVGGPPVFPVVAASGVRLKLADGRELIDGMASWWCAIHGYNHPALNAAVQRQQQAMSHVMFGGLTHEPAVLLAERLVKIAPPELRRVFFADSGSVAVEVALKMSIQYHATRGAPRRQKFIALRGGYHGDTLGAMSVCDPVTGMHTLFNQVLARQYFADRPRTAFDAEWDTRDIDSLRVLLEQHRDEIAALILEPIVQGAGGMWFYHPEYLRQARTLCNEHGVLLIADEIATGFGRSGRLFAFEHAGVAPDILCLGKALTGGTMTLAATLTTAQVAETISDGGRGALMHGPTFMANPLACAAALASIDLLLGGEWQRRVEAIDRQLRSGLAPCRELRGVRDVRVLGAIGVVELAQPVDMHTMPGEFVKRGVWVRPFGKLVYLMPPYVMEADDVARLCRAIGEVIQLQVTSEE